jgi:formylglycine-generating enzyme required for sulfatase activity
MFSKRRFNHLAASLVLTLLLCIGIPAAIGQESNSVWEDSDTGLSWTVMDNGEDISWNQANNYCEMLSLGGFDDWHLPTIDELKKIFDRSQAKQYKAKGPIELGSANIWSVSKNNSGDAWSLNFSYGGKSLSPTGGGCGSSGRALCVRRPAK